MGSEPGSPPARANEAERTSAWRPRLVPMVGAAVCALAAWVSFGLMAVVGDAASPRMGILPAWWVPTVAGAALLALAGWTRIRERAWWPAFIPSVLLLPWLPFSVPAAFLLWTGPVVWLVWAGTAAAVVVVAGGKAGALPHAWLREPRRAAWVAFAASLAVYAVAAWTSSAIRPIGDEPQYLIITQSILLDADLQIENNHKREDYVAYYSADLKPDYLRRGKNGQIYSIHAPGLPALVAPAFALGGYPGVVVFLVLLSAIGAWLVWSTSYALTGDAGAAWFGWAATALSAPYLCHSGAVFPDGPSAVLVLTGIAALVRMERTASSDGVAQTSWFAAPAKLELRPTPESTAASVAWFLHGLALAILPWLHTRAAAAAGVVGACIAIRLIGRREWRHLAAFIAAPLVSAIGWFGFFYAVYGSVDPSSPYRPYSQSSLANVWSGLAALLLDQEYGVIPNAPVYGIALAGLALMFWRHRRLAIELALLVLVYLSAVASYSMWWGGWSAPARFAVAVLLGLGPCAAYFWTRAGAVGRTVASLTLGVSLLASAVFATMDGGRLMLKEREGAARWLEWLCPVVDLPRGLPSYFRSGAGAMLADAGIWVAVLIVAGLVLKRVCEAAPKRASREGGEPRPTLGTAASLLFAAAVMVAATVVWAAHGAVAVTPTSGQLRLMSSFDPAALPVGIQFRPLRVRPSADLVNTLRVSASERRPARPSAPLLAIKEFPAGTYRLLRAPSAQGPRDLEVRIFQSPRPLQACPFEAMPPADCIVHLPVSVTELSVRAAAGSPSQQTTPRTFALQPLDLLAPRERPTRDKASAAARYGAFAVFAFDETVFLEPSGFWVTGGVDTALVLASDEPRPSMPVLLRNGARPNVVHLRGAGVELGIPLAPREEREVMLLLDARSQAAFVHVRAEQGFKPSETNAASRDQRYLGVWIQLADAGRR